MMMWKAVFVACAAAIGSSIACTGALAQAVDLEKEYLKRLKRNGSIDRIYKVSGYTVTSLRIRGNVQTNGIKFVLPNVVPQKPLVLQQQNLANCNDRESTLHASVNKSTENSESFSKTTSISSTTTITAGYSSPLGFSGEVSQSLEVSGSWTNEQTHSETVGWDAGVDVPVGPMKAVQIQFVVAEQKLNVPWWTDVIVSGPVELTYVRQPRTTVCLYEHVNYRGKRKCFTVTRNWSYSNFKDAGWEGGGGDINDEASSVRVSGPADVYLYQHTNYGGRSWKYTGSKGWVGDSANDLFSSIKIHPKPNTVVKKVNLEQYLRSNKERAVHLTGTYVGVNGVQGDFRTSTPLELSPSDCGMVSSRSRTAPRTMVRSAAPGELKRAKPFTSKPIAKVKPKLIRVNKK